MSESRGPDEPPLRLLQCAFGFVVFVIFVFNPYLLRASTSATKSEISRR